MGTSIQWLHPLFQGNHALNLPSISVHFIEHMKNTQRQKMTSTIGTTLIATGLAFGSWLLAMVGPTVWLRRRFSRGRGAACAAVTLP
jgi:hypothetical protein